MKKAAAISALLLLAFATNGCSVAQAPELPRQTQPKVPEDKRKAFGKELMPKGDTKKVPATK